MKVQPGPSSDVVKPTSTPSPDIELIGTKVVKIEDGYTVSFGVGNRGGTIQADLSGATILILNGQTKEYPAQVPTPWLFNNNKGAEFLFQLKPNETQQALLSSGALIIRLRFTVEYIQGGARTHYNFEGEFDPTLKELKLLKNQRETVNN